jgi:hypothetical protein
LGLLPQRRSRVVARHTARAAPDGTHMTHRSGISVPVYRGTPPDRRE